MAGSKRRLNGKAKPSKKAKRSAFSTVKGPAWSLNAGALVPAAKGFPRMMRTTMCYRSQYNSVNPTAGGLAAVHVFSANGLYDVDITGTGHQPTGFDQLMDLYDHYVVSKCRAVVTFTNQDASNRQTVCLAALDNLGTFTDIRRYIENGDCAFTELDLSSSANSMKTLTYEVDVLKRQGRVGKLSDPELKGTNSSNPAESCFLHVVAQPHTSVDAAAVGVNATFYFDVVFIERKTAVLS